jgi:hypothetical protein
MNSKVDFVEHLGENQKDALEKEAERYLELLRMMEEEREKKLKSYPEYRELEQKEQILLDEFPFIPHLFEGYHLCKKEQPTRAQWRGMIDFLVLSSQKRVYEELETLLMGYKICMICSRSSLEDIQ